MIRFLIKSLVAMALLVLALYHFKVRFDDGKVIVERRGGGERRRIERTLEKVGAQAKELRLEFREAPAQAAPVAAGTSERAAKASDHIPEADRKALADLLEESP